MCTKIDVVKFSCNTTLLALAKISHYTVAGTAMVQGPPQKLQGNVGEDSCRSTQQWWYRLHLTHIMEVSMVYSGLAVVSVF